MRVNGVMRRPLLIALVPAALATICWAGCSIERDYAILSFFFEGVPTPEELREQETGPGLAVAQNYVLHAPFAEDACLECHVSTVQIELSRDDSGMCVRCHEGVPAQYAIMHGPVADACLWCHDPHLSGHKHLLRQRSPELCLQCHDQGHMNTALPVHEDPATDCLECHLGHGGPTRDFLRPSYRNKEADRVAVAPGRGHGS